MATLEELIRRRKEELKLSFRELGRRAVDAGGKGPNWAHLANKPLREFPKIRTIRALAKALEVTPWEVAQSALESITLHAKEAGSIAEPGERWIIVSVQDLTPEDEVVIRQRIAEVTSELHCENDPS